MNRCLAALVALGLALSGCTGNTSEELSPERARTSTSTGATDKAANVPTQLVGSGRSLERGTYQLSVQGLPAVDSRDALMEVPEGFDDGGSWFVVSPDVDTFLGLWSVGKIQRDACRRPLHDYVKPGPSVEDLVNLLVAQKGTRATAPEPVTLAGHDALHLRLTGPREVSTCDENPGISNSRGFYSDRQVDLLWILDVDGRRVVVDASFGPTATRSEKDALVAMVRSLQFVPASRG
jgi:hypothetical protein